jgi:hypothetical protein
MRAFYESLVDVIPCPICRQHYEDNLKTMPLDEPIKSRMGLVKWVFDMHNKINVQLGKREITFDEFIESMKNLENAKKSVPPSFHETNIPNIAIFDLKKFSLLEGLILGSGITLIAGASVYYLYQETIRKSTK